MSFFYRCNTQNKSVWHVVTFETRWSFSAHAIDLWYCSAACMITKNSILFHSTLYYSILSKWDEKHGPASCYIRCGLILIWRWVQRRKSSKEFFFLLQTVFRLHPPPPVKWGEGVCYKASGMWSQKDLWNHIRLKCRRHTCSVYLHLDGFHLQTSWGEGQVGLGCRADVQQEPPAARRRRGSLTR